MTTLDIMQECTQLFSREDTLAYFDFMFGLPPIEGLCRIAHPKKGAGGKEYVSLVFIIDTSTDAERTYAMKTLKQLGSGALETMLPEIDAAISVPPRSTGQQIYIKHFDLLLKQPFRPSQEFIAHRLYPAINAALSLQAAELGWWETAEKAPLKKPESVGKQKSFMARLQEKIFG